MLRSKAAIRTAIMCSAGPRGVGGYSLTAQRHLGAGQDAPAPKDFGPHFDFPPEPLNGAPLHDPYPN